MALRKYQATSNADAQVRHTGDGFVFVRGSPIAGPPIWPPPPPPCQPENLHTGEVGWEYNGCYWTYTAPPCPIIGTILSGPNSTTDVTYDAGCGPVQIGYAHVYSVADGNCGSNEETRYECVEGDFATCNGNIYHSDAQCNVTYRPETPP